MPLKPHPSWLKPNSHQETYLPRTGHRCHCTVQSRMSICWLSQELTPWHCENWEACKNQAITCRPFHPAYGSFSINFWQSGTWKNIYPSHEMNTQCLILQVIHMKHIHIFVISITWVPCLLIKFFLCNACKLAAIFSELNVLIIFHNNFSGNSIFSAAFLYTSYTTLSVLRQLLDVWSCGI